jgi:hypothetical protein
MHYMTYIFSDANHHNNYFQAPGCVKKVQKLVLEHVANNCSFVIMSCV